MRSGWKRITQPVVCWDRATFPASRVNTYLFRALVYGREPPRFLRRVVAAVRVERSATHTGIDTLVESSRIPEFFLLSKELEIFSWLGASCPESASSACQHRMRQNLSDALNKSDTKGEQKSSARREAIGATCVALGQERQLGAA